jgi:hypothetical protein
LTKKAPYKGLGADSEEKAPSTNAELPHGIGKARNLTLVYAAGQATVRAADSTI